MKSFIFLSTLVGINLLSGIAFGAELNPIVKCEVGFSQFGPINGSENHQEIPVEITMSKLKASDPNKWTFGSAKVEIVPGQTVDIALSTSFVYGRHHLYMNSEHMKNSGSSTQIMSAITALESADENLSWPNGQSGSASVFNMHTNVELRTKLINEHPKQYIVGKDIVISASGSYATIGAGTRLPDGFLNVGDIPQIEIGCTFTTK